MNENNTSTILGKYNLNIGDVLVIEHREWRIAEERNQEVILYREGIDGSSRIYALSEDLLIKILEDQPR
ncbi:MAG: hypothetical protein ABIA75_01835 [Candidatus Neomarinimicrobiota bacterium]